MANRTDPTAATVHGTNPQVRDAGCGSVNISWFAADYCSEADKRLLSTRALLSHGVLSHTVKLAEAAVARSCTDC